MRSSSGLAMKVKTLDQGSHQSFEKQYEAWFVFGSEILLDVMPIIEYKN